MKARNLLVVSIILGISLLVIATLNYPGGSEVNHFSVGFNWQHNFISNLFAEKAINGASNSARFWAMVGMIFISIGFSVFFVEFSKRIPSKSADNVIKYLGGLGMFFTFLIATPLHDIMVTLATTLFLLCIFYITVFVFMSKLHLFKLLCLIYLLVFYGILYIFGSGDFREYLPIIQKSLFGITIILILSLEYFTKKEDFEPLKK